MRNAPTIRDETGDLQVYERTFVVGAADIRVYFIGYAIDRPVCGAWKTRADAENVLAAMTTVDDPIAALIDEELGL